MTELAQELVTARPRIALALSGGGSRAAAFHLGCLRGLRNAGLLEDVAVMSSVSGGSVLAALYCSTPGNFDEFETKARQVLRDGFFRGALRAAVTTPEGVLALITFGLVLGERLAAMMVGLALLPFASVRNHLRWLKEPAVRRLASRTTILRRAFDKTFGHRALAELRHDRPPLVIIACELRAKAAIYFTAARIQCWRYGEAAAQGVSLADAVAASAAHPLLLPALDVSMTFTRRSETRVRRLTLTDGGVYDNLGLAPFWPGRDPAISMPVPEFDRIIACRADYPLDVGVPSVSLVPRLRAAFECVHARAQNSAISRLHDLAAAGRLRGILHPYLGQDDARLAAAPADLVPRDDVAGYPADFFAMREDWIDKLVRRGEGLVAALLSEHWPDMVEHPRAAQSEL